ncbi:hypothetical protein SLEP1_g21225 [Rubroshorea leprosula]|uniref:Reverse transcriptase Ty1/copia-type domain-containing protein n=1 Tax=Rubroshorea leprosula TaxID=152421 RepID=A0AAV5J8G5_9ROSI|nr:hypothetical protein SLEP1_g21225 [Rubroshorea leprosula]
MKKERKRKEKGNEERPVGFEQVHGDGFDDPRLWVQEMKRKEKEFLKFLLPFDTTLSQARPQAATPSVSSSEINQVCSLNSSSSSHSAHDLTSSPILLPAYNSTPPPIQHCSPLRSIAQSSPPTKLDTNSVSQQPTSTLPSSPAPSSQLMPTNATSLSPSSNATTDSPLTPHPPPVPPRTHGMITRSQNNIFKPKTLFTMTKHPIDPPLEPTCVSQVLKHHQWRQAMSDEFNALNWPIRQLDVNNAFLHGKLKEDLFMAQPPGFVDASLPQHNSKSDTSLFIYHHGSDCLYFLVYVDDIIVTGNNPKLVDSLIKLMRHTVSIKDLGSLNYFLGVNAIFTPASLFLSQAQYIRDLLDKFGMAEAKSVSSPVATAALQLHQGLKLLDPSLYRCLVGSLQYLNLTWSDITFAVNRLSQFLHAPSNVHMQAAKRILCYLKGFVFHGLLLYRQPLSPLHAFSDSDWASDKDTLQSTTGFIVFLGSTPISWKACKQKAVARSSTEAEYRVSCYFL